MGKSSRADSERHRTEIVTAASRMLRDHGESALSVQGVMAEVGMTHGGFYKHFSSKEELVSLAAEDSFNGLLGVMREISDSSQDSDDAWRELVTQYLSVAHREDRAGGCANTALAADSARAGSGSGIRSAYIAGLTETVSALGQYREAPAERLRALITLVGALTLSRATAGDPISDEFIEVAQRMLAEQ